MPRLLSVNVGLPRDVTWNGKTVRTAIWKSPVEGRRMVRKLDVVGDAQGDLSGHGGDQRAGIRVVCPTGPAALAVQVGTYGVGFKVVEKRSGRGEAADCGERQGDKTECPHFHNRNLAISVKTIPVSRAKAGGRPKQ